MTQASISEENQTQLPLRPRNGDQTQALPRPNRTQLLFEFDMQREILSRERETIDYFLPDPYSPSLVALSSLSPIRIGQLQLEKRYNGGVIYAKTIESPIRAAAVQSIIEDEEGLTERLAVYNIDLKLDIEEYLPEDTIIAIKEPTLTAASSGGYTIRVDHPSDLMVLDPSNPGIPTSLRKGISVSVKSALEWKQEGNSFYGNKKFLAAVSAYSKGLNANNNESDSNIRYDLLRNRAIANIFLGRLRQGQKDAESAIIPGPGSPDENTKLLNTKAFERAGHAAYAIGDYDQADKLYKQALNLSPEQKESMEALKKVEVRIQESRHGDYDFEKMTRSCSKKRNRLDHASYIAITEIRDAGTHGRGLFANKAIQAGDLIICEKALSVSFDSDPLSQPCSILNSKQKRRATGTKPQLLFSVLSKLNYDIEAAKDYFKLFDGNSTYDNPMSIDGVVAIDAFRALSILDHNSIGCPTVRSSSRESQAQLTGDGYPSTGIWLRIAYINHACNGNAMRSFIGDMMVIRATRNIAKDDEIFMPYMLPNVDNTITQGQIQQVWGFKCDCELCLAETSTTTNQRRQRVQLTEKLRKLVSQDLSQIKISQIEDMYIQIKQTYNGTRFNQRPRAALVAPGWLRCRILYRNKSWNKLGEAAVALLQDLGYGIEFLEQNVKIDRQHCLTQPVGIDAAIYASESHKKQGQNKASIEFDKFARSLWNIMFSTSRGFEDKIVEILQ